MGFFSSILGGSKTTTPASGYYALPAEVQSALSSIATQGRKQLTGASGVNMFTPLSQTAQESQAYNLMQLPTTSAGLGGLVGNYLNPFQDYLTQGINKQAQGQYSSYKNALSSAGQMGSNREFLNAAAADEARLNAIGSSMASNYNTAQQTALGQNQQNIQNLLAQAENQRALDLQTKQAPLSGLSALASLLSGTSSYYPAQSAPSQTIKTGGGLGGIGSLFSAGGGVASALGYGSTGSALSGIGTALGFLSDVRAKQDIEYVGKENGHKIYKFAYKSNPNKKFIGVMAQDIIKTNPDAVREHNGIYHVDYNKIGVNFREAA